MSLCLAAVMQQNAVECGGAEMGGEVAESDESTDRRLVDAAVTLISASMAAESTAQVFIELQGWRAWRVRLPGPVQDRVLELGNELAERAKEIQSAATTLRLLGTADIVGAVDRLLAALEPTAALVEERSSDSSRWETAVERYVVARNEAERAIRDALARRERAGAAEGAVDAASLLQRSRSIEERAAMLQSGGESQEPVEPLVADYHEWFGDALDWLPDDLTERFRGEYEGSTLTNKIKAFLSEPTAPSLFAADADPAVFPPWKHPYDRTFKNPLQAQRQMIIEADRRSSRSSRADAVVLIRDLWDRFGHAARSLGQRRAGREQLTIADEYDLQYLVGSMLRCHFDDVRAEEQTPSSAGAGARTDFLLVREQISIELKFVGANLRDGRLGEQIAADLVRYRKHPDIGTLVFLVFDPDRALSNPQGLVADLTRPTDTPAVHVLVAH